LISSFLREDGSHVTLAWIAADKGGRNFPPFDAAVDSVPTKMTFRAIG